MAYRCRKFNACCLLRCRNNSTLNVCLCRRTTTLHQGQGHRKEHEQTCYACVYRHAKVGCHIKHNPRYGCHSTSSTCVNLRRTCDLEQGHQTEKRLYRPLVGQSSCVTSNVMGIAFWTNRTFIVFMNKICVTLNAGQGQDT